MTLAFLIEGEYLCVAADATRADASAEAIKVFKVSPTVLAQATTDDGADHSIGK